MKTLNEHIKNVFYVLIGACSFGFLSLFIKLAYRLKIPSYYITFSQFFYGFILFGLFLIFMKEKLNNIKIINLNNWLNLFLTGFFSYLTAYLYNESLNYLPASIAIILLFQFTWMCILFDIFLTNKMPKKQTIYGLLLLLLGAIFSSGIINNQGALTLNGTIYGLMSAISFTLFLYHSKKISLIINPALKTFFILFSASLCSLVVFSISLKNNNFIDFISIISKYDTLLIYCLYGLILGLFGSLIPTYFITLGAPYLSMGLSSILSSIELPIVIFTSYFWLKEQISLIQIIGVLLIFFGIIVSQFDQ